MIDRIPTGEDIQLGDLQVTFDFSVLDGLNEAEHGQLTFCLYSEDELLNEQVVPIELLARDEWGGSAECPFRAMISRLPIRLFYETTA